MSTNLIPFTYQDQPVRVIEKDGEPWFVASDALEILSVDRTSLRGLDDDEKGVDSIHTPGGTQGVTIVSEAGLYSLILRSRKPEAKTFKRWVTHDVLPSIRKTGSYVAPVSREQQLAQAVVLAQQVIAEQDQKVRELTPKAQSFDHFLSAVNDYSVAVVSQALNRAGARTGRNRLFTTLEDLKWIYKPDGATQWRLYQRISDQGLAACRMGQYEDPNTGVVHATYTIRITPKGLHKLAQHFGVTLTEEDLNHAAA